MQKIEKHEILNAPKIAYFSGLGGVELKKIDYYNNAAYIVANARYGKPSAHKLKIYYSPKNDYNYIILNGYRMPFDEFLRDGSCL